MVGQKVVVEQGEQRVLVRLGEVIVAEHKPATRTGECVARPEHVAAMWQLAVQRTPLVPVSAGKKLFDQSVQSRPLSVYEEASQ